MPAPTSVRCERCGYDLREQPDEGACPECGQTLAESIRRRRRARNATILLVLAGPGFLALEIAGFFVVLAIDAFAIFDPPFLFAATAAPLVAALAAVGLRVGGVRCHRGALAAFLACAGLGWLAVMGLVAAASASV